MRMPRPVLPGALCGELKLTAVVSGVGATGWLNVIERCVRSRDNQGKPPEQVREHAENTREIGTFVGRWSAPNGVRRVSRIQFCAALPAVLFVYPSPSASTPVRGRRPDSVRRCAFLALLLAPAVLKNDVTVKRRLAGGHQGVCQPLSPVERKSLHILEVRGLLFLLDACRVLSQITGRPESPGITVTKTTGCSLRYQAEKTAEPAARDADPGRRRFQQVVCPIWRTETSNRRREVVAMSHPHQDLEQLWRDIGRCAFGCCLAPFNDTRLRSYQDEAKNAK